MTKNSEHYAVVIGIDGYSQLPPLKSAGPDAQRFADWLRSGSGGGLHPNNIHLLLSPPAIPVDPMEARPSLTDVDQALEKIIQTNRKNQIKRLYFYFGGHGYGPSFDDVGMLMANASMSRFHSIRLREYREFLRQSGHFPEIVFVLDCSRVYLLDGSPAPPPSPVLPPSQQPAGSNDFILMASSHGEPAFEVTDAEDGGRRGLLTTAILEGLKGEAVDSNQRITALSLSNYVRWRVPKLAGEVSLRQLPEILLPTEEMVFAEKSATSKQLSTGTLVVEVPHWASVIRIYDNVFRSISAGEIKAAPKSPGLYLSETTLPEGIYRVEVTLEGHSASQLVSINVDAPVRLTHDSWGLKTDSTAPLQGSATTHERHMKSAAEWSHKHTWKNGPGGASRLFLFVRTPDPRRYKKFADGLKLLDANEKLITDFSTGVEKNQRQGWMAFCCDLAPGFYILRRGRRGIPVRYQPLYLCANWQTQVFLLARTAPSLSSLTLNMAKYSKGFVPDDETAIAADAVLDGMRRGTSGKRLVTGSKLNALLRRKFENPWLGILAAYALRSDASFSPQATSRADQKSSAELLKQVMSFLSTIKDHPDVRALELKEKKKSDPFNYPPLLYAGLKLVTRHATQFSQTIPLGSLTDRILDDLVIKSPWTAWGEPETTKLPKTVKAKQGLGSMPESAGALPSVAPIYVQSGVQNPVFQFFEARVQRGARPTEAAPEATLTGTASATAALSSAQVIVAAQKLAGSGDIETLSDTVALNPTQQLHDLLTQLNAKEVSAISGLPLSRVEDTLKQLVKSSESPASAPTDPSSPVLSKTEQVVLECALKQSLTPEEIKVEPKRSSKKKSRKGSFKTLKGKAEAVNLAPPAAAVPMMESVETSSGASPLVSLEECILKIRAEADRISLKYQSAGSTPDPEAKAKAENLAGRLRKVSMWLLERASFTAITDSEGRMRSISGAFDALLNPPGSTVGTTFEKQRQENQKLWETALASAPLGSSVLQNPITDAAITPPLQQLLLRRTAMEEDATKSIQAYLNALRSKDALGAKPAAIQQIDSLVPELSLYTSFFTYDTSPRLSEHVEMLEKLTAQLEQIVGSVEV